MIDEDYTEDDRYDWDRNDESQYCQHGKFIGSWWGPDILCGYCEEGVTVEEMNQEFEYRDLYGMIDKIDKFAVLLQSVFKKTWDQCKEKAHDENDDFDTEKFLKLLAEAFNADKYGSTQAGITNFFHSFLEFLPNELKVEVQ